ncbi:MAG: hypothetical protein IKB82_06030, partial [Clostridia bacterium]|nr:hypothetical protein [Clostridia bacterium]
NKRGQLNCTGSSCGLFNSLSEAYINNIKVELNLKGDQGKYEESDATLYRGLRIGDAQVSEKHAGFIVNRGSATARDILALMDEVSRRVREQFGVTLEPEVRILGEDA